LGTSAPERHAPFVDSFFIDPLRAAWGVGTWLRDLELVARDLIASIAQAETEGNPTKIIREVSERLVAFVDHERGTLHRLVRRPLRQLLKNASARVAADRSAAQLFANARSVLALHTEVLGLQRRLVELQERFGPTLPHLLVDHVRAAEIDETAIANVRAAADVTRLDQRIARVASLLQHFEESALASPMLSQCRDGEIDPEVPVTLTELLGYRELTLLRRRNQSVGIQTLSFSASVTAATTLAIIDAQTPVHPDESSLVAAVVERQAVRALNRWTDGPASEATNFMTGVLGAGANGMIPDAERFVWRPPIGSFRQAIGEMPGGLNAEEVDASTFYSIPIGNDYVLFSGALTSLARLYSRTLRLGEVVECTARPVGEVDTPPANTSEMDLQRQFAGLDPSVSRWYRTARRAQVRVIARCGDEWYGRIERQGELEPRPEPGASDRSPVVGSFRILRRPTISTHFDENTPSVEAMVTGSPRIFLGLRSVTVTTPFSEHRRGLVRSFSGRSKRGVEAVQRELNLLTQLDLARKVQRIRGISSIGALGSVSLPRARNTGRIQLWPCYNVPLAGWEADYDRTWIQADLANTLAMIAAVSRTVCTVNDLGLSVGAIGFQSFAIGIGWRTPSCNPIPKTTLVSAPIACRFGDKYYDPSEADFPRERHRYIRVPLVADDVERGKRAERAVDVRAFGMFALDLLVKNPTQADHTELSVIDAAAHGDLQFTFPVLAERLLLALSAPDSTERLLRGMKTLAQPKSTLSDWMNSLIAG